MVKILTSKSTSKSGKIWKEILGNLALFFSIFNIMFVIIAAGNFYEIFQYAGFMRANAFRVGSHYYGAYLQESVPWPLNQFAVFLNGIPGWHWSIFQLLFLVAVISGIIFLMVLLVKKFVSRKKEKLTAGEARELEFCKRLMEGNK